MAKVDPLEFRRGDFGNLQGESLDRFLRMLSTFSSQVSGAMKGGMTVGENVRGFVKEVVFTTAASTADAFPLRFPNELSEKPTGMTIVGAWDISTAGKEAPVAVFGPAWAVSGSDLVLLDIGNLSTSKKYRIKLLVW